MSRPLSFRSLAVLVTTAVVSQSALSQEPLPEPRAVTPSQPGVQVQEQGPIHEGFAQPGAQTRGSDLYAPKSPPPPVPELPPETKPSGNDVRWVPGYWMWDADKKDFTWVSGFWRDVPPGREWSPGEWKKAGDQYRYEPGFWKPTTMNQWRIDLPEPPKPLNVEPNTPAPREGMSWIPGAWAYNESAGQYAWRPGYWADPPGNMVYQPEHYRRTNYGYSHVPGYWDYCLEDRGLLYAPVTFAQPYWNNPGWAYTPQFALNLGYGSGWGNGAFFASLSIGSGFGSYYYGPYGSGWSFGLGFGYGGLFPSYLYGGGYYPAWAGYAYRPGFYPWYYSGHGYCNTLYKQYCALNANNPAYPAQVQQNSAATQLGFAPGTAPTNPAVPRSAASAGLAGQGAANSSAVTPLKVNPATKATVAGKANAGLVQPAKQVLAQQQTTARPVTPTSIPSVKPTFTAPSGGNAISQGMSGSRQTFNPQAAAGTPVPTARSSAPAIGTPLPASRPATAGTNLPPAATPRPGNAITQGAGGSRQTFSPPAAGTAAPRAVTTSPAPAMPRAAAPSTAAPRMAPPTAAPRMAPPAAAPRMSPPAAAPRAAPSMPRSAPPAGGMRGARGKT